MRVPDYDSKPKVFNKSSCFENKWYSCSYGLLIIGIIAIPSAFIKYLSTSETA